MKHDEQDGQRPDQEVGADLRCFALLTHHRRQCFDRHFFPGVRHLTEDFFETDRQLDETQRIPAERQEAVLRPNSLRVEKLLEQGFHPIRVRRAAGARAPLAESFVVDLARCKARQRVDARRPDLQQRQSAGGGKPLTNVFRIVLSNEEGVDFNVAADDRSGDIVPLQSRFETIMPNAQPGDLRYPLRSTDDAEEPVGIPHRQVAGPQFGVLGAPGKVCPRAGIAHHHVRAAIDEFAGFLRAGDQSPAFILDGQAAARYRDTNPVLPAAQPIRRHVGHAGGRLRLSVHHEKGSAACKQMLVVEANLLCPQASAGHAHKSESRKLPLAEAHLFQKVVGIGNTGKVGAAALGKTVEKALVQNGSAGNVKACPDRQVRVQDRQAIGIVQRQDEAASIRRRQAEIFGDGARVGLDVRPRQPDIFSLAGASRGREQDGEIGMASHRVSLQPLRTPAPVDPAMAEIRLEDLAIRLQGGRTLQRNGVSGIERGKVGDDRMLREIGLEHHQSAPVAPIGCLAIDAGGEFAIADEPAVGKHERRLVALGGQVRNTEREYRQIASAQSHLHFSEAAYYC